ncbi:hypothetical protein LTV02_38845 [Nocardia yamanashiensis]|uniref:hypothetical protein n=1 Tax=Nocardia yamanashiensis TaxID=209247 RepID=UPI001E5DDD37|nr:hypothetical protein [Nocardia yamanashiensis]UGT41795.1 hypothetical protein LTV02_38845 [Nocardia yamanashiensis]
MTARRLEPHSLQLALPSLSPIADIRAVLATKVPTAASDHGRVMEEHGAQAISGSLELLSIPAALSASTAVAGIVVSER